MKGKVVFCNKMKRLGPPLQFPLFLIEPCESNIIKSGYGLNPIYPHSILSNPFWSFFTVKNSFRITVKTVTLNRRRFPKIRISFPSKIYSFPQTLTPLALARAPVSLFSNYGSFSSPKFVNSFRFVIMNKIAFFKITSQINLSCIYCTL